MAAHLRSNTRSGVSSWRRSREYVRSASSKSSDRRTWRPPRRADVSRSYSLITYRFEDSEQERTEASTCGIRRPDAVGLQKTGEEPLGEILRLVGVVATSAEIPVQWRPVNLTELVESPSRPHIGLVSGGVDHRPARRGEPAPSLPRYPTPGPHRRRPPVRGPCTRGCPR